MIMPCWLLFHRWRPTRITGRGNACNFDLAYCATCAAYRMSLWFEKGERVERHALAAAQARRFLMSVGQRERSAL